MSELKADSALNSQDNITCIFMSSTSKKKLPATDYKEAKRKWTKAKAKYELIKLIEEKEVKTEQRKNSTMIDVTLSGKKFSFNVLKPLTDSLSKAVFNATHENSQRNMSSYKKKKFEEQRTDERTFYVSGKAAVRTTYVYQNRKDGKKSESKVDLLPFSETVKATSKEDAEEQVREKLAEQFEQDHEDSTEVVELSLKDVDFITKSHPRRKQQKTCQ